MVIADIEPVRRLLTTGTAFRDRESVVRILRGLEETAARALQLGDAAARFTSNDELLKQLVTIAEASGDAAETTRWKARQQDAAAARAQLARKKEG